VHPLKRVFVTSVETLNPSVIEANEVRPVSANGFYRRAGKRGLDVALSAVMLFLMSPLLLIVCALVKLTSHGPVFYRQERVGKGGRTFKIVKFRSMVVDADRRGPGLTSAGDPRVTRFGALLRRIKIDELPQLWNVFIGDMSVVGPRPELPVYVANYDSRQRAVLTVRPGITDSASIAFRWEEDLLAQRSDPEQFYKEDILPRKLALNLEYVANMSLEYDFLLIVRTVRSLFSFPSANHKS
jgi:lipopolysaccharide/colanic/teichoic acid biosynthesis glycosyltransferase